MNKIKIGNRTYMIFTVDNVDNDDSWGNVSTKNKKILVKNVNKFENDITLIHEILHCVSYSIGVTEHDERIISALSESIYQIIKDNKKELIDFIKNI